MIQILFLNCLTLMPGSHSAKRGQNVEQTLAKRKICESEKAPNSRKHTRGMNECHTYWHSMNDNRVFVHFSAVIAKSGKWVPTFAVRFVYVTLNVNRT